MSGVGFLPAAPVWLTVLLATVALLSALLVLFRMGATGLLRACLAATLAIYLLNPVRNLVQTAPNKSAALLLLDESGSMAVDMRGAQAQKAAKDIQKQYPAQNWQQIAISTKTDTATKLEPALTAGLSRIAADDLSAVVMVTDGIVHDADTLQRFKSLGKPVHVVLAGNPDLVDRKLSVISAPPYALVDHQAKITIRVDDSSGSPAAQLNWSIDGRQQKPVLVTPNQNMSLVVPITHRGHIDVMMSVAARQNEVTTENNTALVQLNGVRDRLKVLLVSGAPYPGGRLWRDTLKSDPSIDLIHFTILRLPSSFDVAPNSELSLIPFPVEQLFEQRLGSFDLVIFDSFGALDLLDPGYFTNVSDYVKGGGALFVIAGSEFGRSESLSSTALANILPLTPTGVAEDITYTPQTTIAGKRHPITSTLSSGWGPWYQEARVRAETGITLMTGVRGQPLMQIAEVGKGRVGMIASNQLWVWARGEPPGPWNELTRRMSHWLMKEPDLDSEKLAATASGREIIINRSSLSPRDGSALVVAPDGTRTTVQTRKTDSGATGIMSETKTGIYRVTQDGLSTAVMIGGNVLELRDVRPTDKRLRELAESPGGTVTWLNNGMPRLTFDSHASEHVTGIRSVPLFPAWLALLLSVGLAALMWFRERA